ncbi:MAG: hypothetical protein IT307_16750 [Chloroflexi bacterium]|nr:hypothetical protein [Chloroflexota bacterium]
MNPGFWLARGGLYDLFPLEGDIHGVVTRSDGAPVSVHLLANDPGCVWRHVSDLADGNVRAFRSEHSNWACYFQGSCWRGCPWCGGVPL